MSVTEEIEEYKNSPLFQHSQNNFSLHNPHCSGPILSHTTPLYSPSPINSSIAAPPYLPPVPTTAISHNSPSNTQQQLNSTESNSQNLNTNTIPPYPIPSSLPPKRFPPPIQNNFQHGMPPTMHNYGRIPTRPHNMMPPYINSCPNFHIDPRISGPNFNPGISQMHHMIRPQGPPVSHTHSQNSVIPHKSSSTPPFLHDQSGLQNMIPNSSGITTFVNSPLGSPSSVNVPQSLQQPKPPQQPQTNSGQMQPPLSSPNPDNNAENVKKMERFLLMLISLARQKGRPTHMLMQYLVQNLLLGYITEEEFMRHLEQEMDCPPQERLLYLLQESMPYVRENFFSQNPTNKQLRHKKKELMLQQQRQLIEEHRKSKEENQQRTSEQSSVINHKLTSIDSTSNIEDIDTPTTAATKSIGAALTPPTLLLNNNNSSNSSSSSTTNNIINNNNDNDNNNSNNSNNNNNSNSNNNNNNNNNNNSNNNSTVTIQSSINKSDKPNSSTNKTTKSSSLLTSISNSNGTLKQDLATNIKVDNHNLHLPHSSSSRSNSPASNNRKQKTTEISSNQKGKKSQETKRFKNQDPTHSPAGEHEIEDDVDETDITTMANIDLKEEAIIAIHTQTIGETTLSTQDSTLLPLSHLYHKVSQMSTNHGITTIDKEPLVLISHAVETRICDILTKLAEINTHRTAQLNSDTNYEVASDVKQQLRIIEEIDRAAVESNAEREKTLLYKAAKQRPNKGDDPELSKMKEKGKQLKREEEESKRKIEADNTALSMIGPRKRSTNSNQDGRKKNNMHSQSEFSHVRYRQSRIIMKDLTFYMSQEPDSRKSSRFYKALLK